MQLNFPPVDLKYKQEGEKKWIWDIIRKKYIVVGPEEIVRQHLIHFLIQHRGYPQGLLQVEKQLKWKEHRRRTDLVVYDKKGNPILIVECKAPKVNITQEVFEQISRYNMVLGVKHLIVTNGLCHFFCTIDLNTKQVSYKEDILPYTDLFLYT